MYSLTPSRLLRVAVWLCSLQGVWGDMAVSVPEELYAEVGGSVSIPCTHSITGKLHSVIVEWFIVNRNGQRQRISYQAQGEKVLDANTDYTHRLSVNEDHTLTLTHVRVSDHRAFVCQVMAGTAGTREGQTQLRVYDIPEPPEVTPNRATLSVTDQHPSQIGTCTSRNGFPAPNIVWFKDGTLLPEVLNNNANIYMSPRVVKEANGLYTVSNTLFYKLSRSDKLSTFYCQVLYKIRDSESTLDSNPFPITLHYHTEKVTFGVRSLGEVKEGDNVTFHCLSDGEPQPDYLFLRQQEGEWLELGADPHGELVLVSVTKADSGVYECEVLDFDSPPDVELKRNVTIFVNYIDELTVLPLGDHVYPLGADIDLECSTRASLTPHLSWAKGGLPVSPSGTLTLRNLTYGESGRYVCEAIVPDIKGLTRTTHITLTVEGKPSMGVESSPRATVSREGERVSLSCVSSGYPQPHIKWSIDTRPTVMVGEFSVTSHVSVPVTFRLLRSGVSCNASNTHGWTQRHFRLAIVPPTTSPPRTSDDDRQSGGGSGGAVIAVSVCVLLLLVVVGCLYLLHKKERLPCGKTPDKKTPVHSQVKNDNIVVEMKSGQNPETSGLLESRHQPSHKS